MSYKTNPWDKLNCPNSVMELQHKNLEFFKTVFKLCIVVTSEIPYFFGYKTESFSFQNNSKNLDPSYKMDLDLWDCLGRPKLVL